MNRELAPTLTRLRTGGVHPIRCQGRLCIEITRHDDPEVVREYGEYCAAFYGHYQARAGGYGNGPDEAVRRLAMITGNQLDQVLAECVFLTNCDGYAIPPEICGRSIAIADWEEVPLAAEFSPEDFLHPNVPPLLRSVATWFCELFKIQGTADPMYIVNTVAMIKGIGDGRGNFGPDMGEAGSEPELRIAKRLTAAFGTSVEMAGFQDNQVVPLLLEVLRAMWTQPRRLTCCCCGESTSGRQWHNRDTGFGLCPGCIERCQRNITLADFTSCYGVQGIHFAMGDNEQ